jgi:hypothetical protein
MPPGPPSPCEDHLRSPAFVRRCAASRRAPGYQEAAPGERGDAAHAISTAVASAHPACSMLGRRPAEPRGTPPRRAEASG